MYNLSSGSITPFLCVGHILSKIYDGKSFPIEPLKETPSLWIMFITVDMVFVGSYL